MLKKINNSLAFLYIFPAIIFLIFSVVIPNLYSLYLAFTNYSLYHFDKFSFIGLKNFYIILKTQKGLFLRVFSWTLIWSTISVIFSLAIGTILAIILNNKELKFKEIYRTLLIIPWALPSFISVLIWAGLFNPDLGIINNILQFFHISKIPWLTNPFWAKVAVLTVNIWLGFPFMMSVVLGALQAIPADIYEAASIDGATNFEKFKYITMPLLKKALIPVIITSFAFNFNQFNTIYLLTEGGPPVMGSAAGATDILVTFAYKLSFNQFKFGLASAYAIFIFMVLVGLSSLNFKITGALNEK